MPALLSFGSSRSFPSESVSFRRRPQAATCRSSSRQQPRVLSIPSATRCSFPELLLVVPAAAPEPPRVSFLPFLLPSFACSRAKMPPLLCFLTSRGPCLQPLPPSLRKPRCGSNRVQVVVYFLAMFFLRRSSLPRHTGAPTSSSPARLWGPAKAALGASHHAAFLTCLLCSGRHRRNAPPQSRSRPPWRPSSATPSAPEMAFLRWPPSSAPASSGHQSL
ncbi:uncharacterized protein LOC119284398 [Triticum dicoccoides]|uniref:uncharacterized protein LOC119284398 n=1 Tax=Triticum dicoccoides TaxID=85692 RepID=UPI00188EA5F8|nr:uncharacterized protein LOC119284398 [Triticum dicoccoides]